jgi:hypothetical protein
VSTTRAYRGPHGGVAVRWTFELGEAGRLVELDAQPD